MKTVLLAYNQPCFSSHLEISFLQCYTVEGLGVLPHNDRHANLAQK